MNSGPLGEIRVLDVSAGGVGPWAGALLGQLGADVVKVEPPSGDFIRNNAPMQRGLSTTYLAVNLNKRGMVLDLKQPEDRGRAHALAAGADVLIENYRPGVAERLGLGWEEVSRLNPQLVYASASGFGWSGPMVALGATDPHIQAFTGAASVNGAPGGPFERLRWYGHIDMTTSLCIVQGILAALLDRRKTGRGRLVRITMVEAAMALQRVRVGEHLDGGDPRPMGSGITYLVPDRVFETLDGPVAVSVTSPAQWRRFCEAVRCRDLVEDTRFADNRARVRHREELEARLEPVFAARPVGHWLRTLERAQVPCAKLTDFDEFRHNRHYRDEGMVETLATRHWGDLTVAGPPWRFERRPARVSPPPKPGEHTREILANGWGEGR